MSRVPQLQFRREDIPDLSTGERTDKLLRGLNGFGAATDGLLNGGLTFKENFKAFAKEITFTTRDEWVAITPTAPWTASSPAPAVRKRGARVELRGQLAVNTATTLSYAFTLASGYAPAVASRLALAGYDGSAAPVAAILSQNGANATMSFAAGATTIALDGSYWDAADTASGVNGVFPISIKNEIPGSPVVQHVWLTRVVDTTNDREEPVAAGAVAWSVSRDQIVIRDIGNLCANRRYKCRILVAAE